MNNLGIRLGHAFGLGLFAIAAACGSDDPADESGNTGGASGTGGAGGGGGTAALPDFDAGSAADRNKVAPGALCARLAEIQCAGEAHCCTSPGRDVATCVAAQKKICEDPVNFDDVAKDPKTGFDAAKAEAAFAHFEELASKCDPQIAAYGADPNGFRGMVQGSVAAGGTCDPKTLAQPVEVGVALASCKDPSQQACVPHDTGTPPNFGWKCEPRGADGATCFTDLNCQDGLFCDNPKLTFTNTTKCKPRKAAGADCTLANECASFGCSADGKCEEATAQTAYCLGG